jgi:hypothetical protein
VSGEHPMDQAWPQRERTLLAVPPLSRLLAATRKASDDALRALLGTGDDAHRQLVWVDEDGAVVAGVIEAFKDEDAVLHQADLLDGKSVCLNDHIMVSGGALQQRLHLGLQRRKDAGGGRGDLGKLETEGAQIGDLGRKGWRPRSWGAFWEVVPGLFWRQGHRSAESDDTAGDGQEPTGSEEVRS